VPRDFFPDNCPPPLRLLWNWDLVLVSAWFSASYDKTSFFSQGFLLSPSSKRRLALPFHCAIPRSPFLPLLASLSLSSPHLFLFFPERSLQGHRRPRLFFLPPGSSPPDGKVLSEAFPLARTPVDPASAATTPPLLISPGVQFTSPRSLCL